MPTIETTPSPLTPSRGAQPGANLARGSARSPKWQRRAWPLVVIPILLALVAWRATSAGERAQPSSDRAADTTTALGTRTFDGLQLGVPSSWTTLDRAAGHVTWGSAGRTHTVTLASTEASLLPLPGVVSAVADDSARALPGATLVGRPTIVELGPRMPLGDAAMMVRFVVSGGGGSDLRVAQVWRRDSRAGLDIVATWTSADGVWPAPPTTTIPRASASE